MSADDDAAVRALGERIGYGNLMHITERMWRESLEPVGLAGGEFAVGPCVRALVPCECTFQTGRLDLCDWCCGTGRITQRVSDAQNEWHE